MDELKIGILQFDIIWENKSLNFNLIDSYLRENFSSEDIVILPEMFSTGFSMSAADLSEFIDGITMQKLLYWASKFNTCMAASFICKGEEGFVNKFVAVHPDGSFVDYDKKYLFSPAKETNVYIPGNQLSFFEIKGWSICPQICYDLRFPEWPRSTSRPIDLLLYTASWPESRIGHWDKLIAARAIENQCFSAGINRTGQDGNGYVYNGHSVIKDWNGENILHCKEKEGYYSCSISPNHKPYRDSINFLRDKRPFQFDV